MLNRLILTSDANSSDVKHPSISNNSDANRSNAYSCDANPSNANSCDGNPSNASSLLLIYI